MASIYNRLSQSPASSESDQLARQFGPSNLDLRGVTYKQAEMLATATAGKERQCWIEAAAWLKAAQCNHRDNPAKTDLQNSD